MVTTARSEPRLGRRPRMALLVAGMFFAAQLLLPILQLTSSPLPSRWGWQMFSRLDPRAYVLVLADGAEVAVDVAATAVRLRADVDFERHLPRHLCTEGVAGIEVRELEERARWLPCP